MATRTNEYEILFDFFVHRIDGFFSVIQCYRGLVVFFGPLLEVRFVDIFVGQAQSPQAFPSKFLWMNESHGDGWKLVPRDAKNLGTARKSTHV